MKEKKLHGLQTEYDQMVRDAEEAMNTDAGESEDAQVNSCQLFKPQIHASPAVNSDGDQMQQKPGCLLSYQVFSSRPSNFQGY